MSQPRFAPITASLLSRKGEASPLCAKQPLAWLQGVTPQSAQSMPPPMAQMSHGMVDPAEKPHRIMVALSNREYETLGIAAVKKGTTRHRIAREAMDHYFATLAREFHDQCRCVSDAAREGGCCRDA